MKHFKNILAFALSLAAIQGVSAQSGTYGGLSMLSIPTLQPRPGAFVGFENGNANLKWSIGFNASLVRFGLTNDTVNAVQISNNEASKVVFKRKLGYMAVPVMFKYYLFDTEETVGSNVSFGLGIAMQLISNRTIDDYDRSVYSVNENAYNHYVGREVNLAFTGLVGYQYSFDSGLALTGHIGYELGLENVLDYFDQVGSPGNGSSPSYFSYTKVNVLTVGVGAKYLF